MSDYGEPLWNKYLKRPPSASDSCAQRGDQIWHFALQSGASESSPALSPGCPLPQDWENRKYAAFDVETTGLDPIRDRIIEIGLVEFEFDREGALTVTDEFSALVCPEISIPPAASAIHGLTDDDVAKAPKFKFLAVDLLAKIAGRVVVAHNASFDLSFLKEELMRAGIENPIVEWVDSLPLARLAYPNLLSYNLGKAAFALGISSGRNHRALDDATTCMHLFALCARRTSGKCD